MTEEYHLRSDEIPIDPSTVGQFRVLWFLELVVSIMLTILGGILFVGDVTYSIIERLGYPVVPPDWIIGKFAIGFAIAVLGLIAVRIAAALENYEMWTFSALLYVNLISAGSLILTELSTGLYAAVFVLVPVVLLFLPGVKSYWWETFVEDMVPRLREFRYSMHLVRKSPLVVVGIVIIVAFVILALLAPWVAPYGPEERIWADTNLPPGSPSNVPGNPVHYWGTDNSGGDVFSRILYGAQVDLRVAITVVIVAIVIGTFLGAVSGYYGGKLDELLMRVTDVFFAFPGLILAMAIVMALGSRSLENISVALMVTWWPTYARLVRGQVLLEREKLYVEAARSVGASDARILIYHIIPNTIQPIIVQATMDTGAVLLVAAGLSFIGFGPPAGIAEWGLMIAKGQEYFSISPWAVFFPGFAILLVSLALNLVGDGIRDILDPKLRRR